MLKTQIYVTRPQCVNIALSHPESPLTLGQFHCILIEGPTNGLRKLDSLSAAHMNVIPEMNLELHRGLSFM